MDSREPAEHKSSSPGLVVHARSQFLVYEHDFDADHELEVIAFFQLSHHAPMVEIRPEIITVRKPT